MFQTSMIHARHPAQALYEEERMHGDLYDLADGILQQKFPKLQIRSSKEQLPLIGMELLEHNVSSPFELYCKATYGKETEPPVGQEGNQERLGRYKACYTRNLTIICGENEARARNKRPANMRYQKQGVVNDSAEAGDEALCDGDMHYFVYANPPEPVQENELTTYDRQFLLEAAFRDAHLEGKSASIKKYLDIVRSEDGDTSLHAGHLYSNITPINSSGRSGKYTFILQPAVMNTYGIGLGEKLAPIEAPNALIVQIGKMADIERARHASNMQDILQEEGIDVPNQLVKPTRIEGTDFFYSIQEMAPGRHMDFEERHLAALGRILGKIHAISRKDIQTPPTNTVLSKDAVARSVFSAISDTKKREANGTTIETLDDMINSSRHEMLGCATPEQIGEIPNLYETLLFDAEKARHLLAIKQELDNDFPMGCCHGDMTLKNALGYYGPKSNVTVFDCEMTGTGQYIDDIVLTLYFRCVDADGKLDPERTKAFFAPYIEERAKGEQPLTKKEIAALPERIAKLAARQAQPIWEMFRNAPEKKYREFALRHTVLPEQMGRYIAEPVLFMKKFVGVSRFPSYKHESFANLVRNTLSMEGNSWVNQIRAQGGANRYISDL